MKGAKGMMYVLMGLGGLLLGLGAGFLNACITKRMLRKDTTAAIMAVNGLRFLVIFLALGLGYLLCQLLALPLAVPLLCEAVGLSFGGLFFTWKWTKQMQQNDGNASKLGGE